MSDPLYTNSDQNIDIPLVDAITGATVPASSFSGAEYKIFTTRGELKISKTLGAGITVDNDVFKVTLDRPEMTFEGLYTHQFRVINQAGQTLPPCFQENVTIIGVK